MILFISEDDTIYNVGNNKCVEQTGESIDDLIVIKLDMDGNVFTWRNYGGSNIDTVNTSQYDSNLGIIINGSTQSDDGEFDC